MSEQFKAGDVVMLKSGGPEMTINYIDETKKEAECIWFEGFKKCKDTFNPDALEKVEK